jgi:hypothetical protein
MNRIKMDLSKIFCSHYRWGFLDAEMEPEIKEPFIDE